MIQQGQVILILQIRKDDHEINFKSSLEILTTISLNFFFLFEKKYMSITKLFVLEDHRGLI